MERNQPRGKSSGRKFIEVLLVFSVFCILLTIFWPVGSHGGYNSRRSSCQSNLKQIMLGVKQYVQDYDEKYPILATSPAEFGWAGGLQPYLKSTQIFQCPSELTPPEKLPALSGYTDYWFNARMVGVAEKKLDDQALTISLGEGDSSNARYHLTTIPNTWRKDEKSPLHRHLDGPNYAFADGHVKWFRSDKWKTELDMQNGPTLRLQPTKQEVSK